MKPILIRANLITMMILIIFASFSSAMNMNLSKANNQQIINQQKLSKIYIGKVSSIKIPANYNQMLLQFGLPNADSKGIYNVLLIDSFCKSKLEDLPAKIFASATDFFYSNESTSIKNSDVRKDLLQAFHKKGISFLLNYKITESSLSNSSQYCASLAEIVHEHDYEGIHFSLSEFLKMTDIKPYIRHISNCILNIESRSEYKSFTYGLEISSNLLASNDNRNFLKNIDIIPFSYLSIDLISTNDSNSNLYGLIEDLISSINIVKIVFGISSNPNNKDYHDPQRLIESGLLSKEIISGIQNTAESFQINPQNIIYLRKFLGDKIDANSDSNSYFSMRRDGSKLSKLEKKVLSEEINQIEVKQLLTQ